MILTKNVDVKLGGRNREHFEKLGYEFVNGKIINVPIEHLTKRSHADIHVKCDICEKEKHVRYTNYIDNISNKGFYCCSIKCSRIKFKMTCNDIYGVDNVFQSEEIKSKSKKTLMKKFNVEFSQQSKEVRLKSEATKLNKYNNKKYNNPEKNKETCLEKYGVYCVLNLVSYENKKIALDNYYKSHPEQLERLKNWMSSDEFKNKSKETIRKKYNVDHVMHIDSVVNKNHFSGKLLKWYNDDVYYRGTYEKNFLDKYYEKFKIINPKSVKYIFKDKEKRYYPDFYISDLNLLIEIKSSYTFYKDFERNINKHYYSKQLGYNHIFIIDKDYDNFERMIKLSAA